MKLFAFDPGQTTGYCVIQLKDKGRDFEVTRCGEIEWDVRIANTYDVLLELDDPDIIVVESFRLFPHKAMAQTGSIFPSVRLIGIIEATARYIAMIPEDKIQYQEPGDIAKVQVRDGDLHWVAGSPHKIDAYRHARLYFLRHFYMNPFENASSELRS